MFREGDLVRIKNTPHMMGWSNPRGINIGKTFVINFGYDVEKKLVKGWLDGNITSSICDVKNTYGINYHIDDLELVDPIDPIYEIY